MFDLLLLNLRTQGVQAGLGEWLAFLDGVRKGLVVDLDGLYDFGRAVLVHSEAHFDAWDLAFHATFAGVELEPDISDALLDWLAQAQGSEGEVVTVDMDWDELRRRFYERLKEQKERHDGGSYWIGTGGTSPFGNGGRAPGGIQVGGGGARSAVAVAGDRRWQNYRTDQALDIRDFQVALRALRKLIRQGQPELDLDGTIQATANNGGEIELDWDRARENRVHLVLLLDTGGSMDLHARLVTQLFSAAKDLKGFKSFSAYHFHNAPYGYLYRDYASRDRVSIPDILAKLSPHHRLVWVGDASMAPWELFGRTHVEVWGARGQAKGLSGLEWVQRIQQQCPASIWLNPDPVRYWNHPTVRALGAAVPMFPLTLDGLRDGVKKLRMPA
jgi:uncharacterized protein with von Willebrand factor type A (vWA) domain